jgi:selenocysteine lyase/cysteine desulfurase
VAFPHCSNVVGYMNPVAEIASRAKAVGALTVVDGVAAAPHGLPDVAALGCDVYLFSLYKTWGPHLGVMVLKRELLERMTNQGHYFNADKPRKVLLPAGPDHAQVAAAAGVVDYLEAVYQHHFDDESDPAEQSRRILEMFQTHERALLAPVLKWLRERDDVRVVGPTTTANRAPTIAIQPLDRELRDVYQSMVDAKLMVGSGHFYATRLLDAMEIPVDPGILRMSFLHYTTESEIEQLLSGLEWALR